MSKPNLIYVFADQLRYSSLGCNGDEKALTPCIDALSRESTALENCVSGHPVCAPYRASLLTGKYTAARNGTGMVINEIRLNTNHRSFAQVLNDNGYNTGYIGKWHMYADKFNDHYNPESSYIPKGPDRLGFDGFFAAYNFHHEYYAPKAYYHLDSPEKIYIEGYEPDAQTDMAIEQLAKLKAAGKPFALFLSIGTPHDPWVKENVPPEYYELFKNVEFPDPENYVNKNDCPYADLWARLSKKERAELPEWRRVYYAMLANLDMNIGRLNEAIKALKLDENTIFVFSSDHGELFGAHGRRAKNIFYEEAVHVPFFIRYPEKLKAKSCPACVNTVDIMPSLLSLMELEIPKEVQGEDKSALIAQGSSSEGGCLLMGTGAVALFFNGKEWRGWRTERYTYAVYRTPKKEFLFDNVCDPYQKVNLANAPEHAETLGAMRKAMLDKMDEIGDSFEKCSWYKRNWTKKRRILPELPIRKRRFKI